MKVILDICTRCAHSVYAATAFNFRKLVFEFLKSPT